MPRKRRLIALRHTRVEVIPGLCYGQLDVPLAAAYPEDLDAVRSALPSLSQVRVFSSPLTRCLQLAHDLHLGPVTTDVRLMELSFGSWEGLLWAAIPRERSEHWTADVVHRAPPSGESFQQLIVRVSDFLEQPNLSRDGSDLFVVTHAGVIRALQHILGGDDCMTALHLPLRFGEHRIWEI